MDGFLAWFNNIPAVSRGYLTLSIVTTVACSLEIVTPLNLYYNYRLIFEKGQIWRMLTTFVYFGNLGLDFFFHMWFLVRYCSMLEEGSFRNKTADFFWMVFLGAVALLIIAPFVNVLFLGSSLTFMMVYVWGRRNPGMPVNFLGMFQFGAENIAYVLFAFSFLLGSNPIIDLLGIAIGHIYFFFSDVYPIVSGKHWLETPQLVKAIFDQRTDIIQPLNVPTANMFGQGQDQQQQQQQQPDHPHQQ